MNRFFMFFARKHIFFHDSFKADRYYFIPKKGDAAYDFSKISGDMKMIGRDLKYSINNELSQHG